MYIWSFDGRLRDIYHEMELYNKYQVYDTGFCDLIPDIMANVIMTPIIIIDKAGSDYDLYVSNLIMQNSLIGTIQFCPHTCSPIISYRAGYHYDACLKTKPLEYSSFEYKFNDNSFDHHNNVVDSHDCVDDCHDYACDYHVNYHSNVGYSSRNMLDCHDNVFSCHENVVDCHGDVSQDSSPCLEEICNDKCHFGISSPESKEANSNPNGFDNIHCFKGNHPKNMCIGHYLIYSVRNKFYNSFPLFVKYYINILGVAETKLDNSFTSMQFGVGNCKLYRQDRNSKGDDAQ